MVRMSDSAPLPTHLWQNVLSVFEQNNAQGDQRIAVAASATTLQAATTLCTDDASTCSFGLLGSYLDALRTCACSGGTEMPSIGGIRLRTPSDSTAPDAEEMLQCLLHLVDLHPDYTHGRTHMSIEDFGAAVSFLHARVFPIVPQVLHKEENVMHMHMHEGAIKARVEMSPYFNPQTTDDDGPMDNATLATT
jgi:hypothetical protein